MPKSPKRAGNKANLSASAAKPVASKKIGQLPRVAVRTRDNTKQAKLIVRLRRPVGATIAQITKAFGWQHHTVRGVLSGALKKKLGMTVTSTKREGGERIYRLS